METPVPFGEITVNETNGIWSVVKGKQKLTALLCFFLCRVTLRTSTGSKFRWDDSRSSKYGYSKLFKRKFSSQNCSVPWRLQVWYKELEACLRESKLANNELDEESDDLCNFISQDFELSQTLLSMDISVTVMENWPEKAAAYTGLWLRLMQNNYTKQEILYTVPRLQPLKLMEVQVGALCNSFGIDTNNKIPFFNLIKVYQYINGSKYVPSSKSEDDLEHMAHRLIQDFSARKSDRTQKFSLLRLKLGIRHLSTIRNQILGPNKRYPVQKVTEDCFVALLTSSTFMMDVSVHDRVLICFRSRTNHQRVSILGKSRNDEFVRGLKENNLAKTIRATIQKP